MGDIATLLTAIGGLCTALAGAFALVYNTIRMSRKERPAAAKGVARELAAAAEDGEITAEELAAILEKLRDEPESGVTGDERNQD